MPMERKNATVLSMPDRAALVSSASAITPITFSAKRAKAGRFCLINSLRPGTPDGSQRSTVSGVKHGGEFMPELVYRKILHAAETSQAIVESEPAHISSLMES